MSFRKYFPTLQAKKIILLLYFTYLINKSAKFIMVFGINCNSLKIFIILGTHAQTLHNFIKIIL